MPTVPNIASRKRTASVAPASWTTMYPGTRRQGKSPRAAKAMLTAGLRWAPDTAPIERMIAITVRPGAVTSAPRPIAPWLTASITPPPAPTRTRRKVPKSSAKSRRHSCEGSSKPLAHGASTAESSRTSDQSVRLRWSAS